MSAQHRGPDRDLFGDAMKTLVVSGHLAVLGLLGYLVEHQPPQYQPLTAASAPDTDPGTDPGTESL
ncbi:hypothetical protein P3T37_000322 [Kitasatospora sp. MAA4]|uniref:hypothetical protein n=1 Tax=Kitasatospora sp. MAA4 TaxID=3035093 RepID=UPI00247540BA|nr:hypothetical protein [Kitasatospora sp. MAA4]MDH6130955.1 hypothetical protein [Kitasatospora sp. MAA4]